VEFAEDRKIHAFAECDRLTEALQACASDGQIFQPRGYRTVSTVDRGSDVDRKPFILTQTHGFISPEKQQPDRLNITPEKL
jgi:hypothetical protein